MHHLLQAGSKEEQVHWELTKDGKRPDGGCPHDGLRGSLVGGDQAHQQRQQAVSGQQAGAVGGAEGQIAHHLKRCCTHVVRSRPHELLLSA